MKKILSSLVSTSFAGLYIIGFAISIGVATFIENDYGTDAAQKVIYHAWWFELLLFMFGLTLVVNMFKFNMFRREKLPVLTFHLSMIIILLGAAVTRYYGFEGMMHIREGKQSDIIISSETYFDINAQYHGIEQETSQKLRFAGIGNNNYDYAATIDKKSYQIKLKQFHPSASKALGEAENDKGIAILSIVSGGASGRVKTFLKKNEAVLIDGYTFAFHTKQDTTNKDSSTVNIVQKGDELFLLSPVQYGVTTMATQVTDTISDDTLVPLRYNSLYNFDEHLVVFTGFQENAEIIPMSQSIKIQDNMLNAITLDVSSGDSTKEVILWGNRGIVPNPTTVEIDGIQLELSYGSKNIQLPFAIQLKDFQLERYPGSHSASSFASEVQLRDLQDDYTLDYRIFMNNVLDYKGFRFFQSSYDKDELGTILSVNHDWWGTWISYIGYILLTLGLILTLFAPKTRFGRLSKNLSKLSTKKNALTLLLMTMLCSFSIAQTTEVHWQDSIREISATHANDFGHLFVQDKQGRVKPMNTLTSEVLRKVTRASSLYGQNSDQIVLGMLVYPSIWQNIPLIYVKHERIREILGITEKRAAMIDFYDDRGEYLLKSYIEEAVNMKPINRGEFEIQLIKVDERFNIAYMTFSASLLRVFPKADDNNNKWYDPLTASKMDFGDANILTRSFMLFYLGKIDESVKSGDYKDADFALEGLKHYQNNVGHEVIPSETKANLEIWYNKSGVFGYLAMGYALVGCLFLILLLYQLFQPKNQLKYLTWGFIGLIFTGILIHTTGLVVRWYISGHAPWSNGYESMIYIGWAAVMAGLIFVKKSPITLAVTAILTAVILGVAGLSWLDPEITNLVPVLKSYWMTIHVSIIVASYGPFALGALMAFLNLFLIILRNKKNNERITITIKELSNIIEMTLIIGVVMLSIGTYLGGVWANESWGRYWGWDAKETWALVSILVYAFILHMRLIPGMKDVFSFNLAAVIGFFSILMTYFGVNYYLSGLHSYAAGEPAPIPTFVYYMVGIVFVVATIAFFKSDSKERYG